MAEHGENKPAAIKITGGKGISVRDNISIGAPVLEAQNTDDLEAIRNVSVFQSDQPTIEKPLTWKTWAIGAVTALAVTVLGGGILKALGWI